MSKKPTGPTGTLMNELVQARHTIDAKQELIELLASQVSLLKTEVDFWRKEYIKKLEEKYGKPVR